MRAYFEFSDDDLDGVLMACSSVLSLDFSPSELRVAAAVSETSSVGSSERRLSAVATKASPGHALKESIVQQLIKLETV